MFGAQCYFDEEVWESQGLVRASLEAMLGAWCWKKPLSTDMGPPAAGLAATIATDTTSVGQPQAAEGAQISSNHHSSLIFFSLAMSRLITTPHFIRATVYAKKRFAVISSFENSGNLRNETV